jgi:hypothetical protein
MRKIKAGGFGAFLETEPITSEHGFAGRGGFDGVLACGEPLDH